jgi:hypothetical protein
VHRQGLNRGGGTSTVPNNEFNRHVRVSLAHAEPGIVAGFQLTT